MIRHENSCYRQEPIWSVYRGAAAAYARSRPQYPEEVLNEIAGYLSSANVPPVILDVGCGTGIFTRQLAHRFGASFAVKGIEPSDDMLEQARESFPGAETIEYLNARADHLPATDASVGLISAATSAQQFNRSDFYMEAARVLGRGGTLALLLNRHRYWENALLDDLETLLEKYVHGYHRGTFTDWRGFRSDLDFYQELCRQKEFGHLRKLTIDWSYIATKRVLEDYLFSRGGDIDQILSALGARGTRAEIERLCKRHRDLHGRLSISMRTDLVLCVRR